MLPLALVAGAAWSQANTEAEPAVAARPERIGQRSDERRPERATVVDLAGRPVELSGSWEFSHERRGNFDLDDTRAADRVVREHEMKLEARSRVAVDTDVFMQVVGRHEVRRTQGGSRRTTRALERGQMWLQRDRLGGTPWSLQFGRVALDERRSWWWDEDLDAVRLRGQWPLRGGEVRLDTGLARELARVSSAERGIATPQRGVTRWFGQATWRWAPRHTLDAFWLLAHDGSGTPSVGARAPDEDRADTSDLQARWLGLRAAGEWRGTTRAAGPVRLAYWSDVAWLRGRETLTDFAPQPDGSLLAGTSVRRRVQGHAFDLGVTLAAREGWQPAVTVGWARGSGGARLGARDDNFRQTGLHENKARMGGVKRWQRYGELLQPELSNLDVGTFGFGLRLFERSSIELVAHHHRQRVPSTELPGARIAARPLGLHRDIGHEWDLLLALREWSSVEVTLAVARFMPGRAFDLTERDPAHSVELGLNLNF